MALHRLTKIVLGVPNVEPTAGYYEEFGLTPTTVTESTRSFATVDGGEQLTLVRTDRRRLVELGVGADDPDDLDRIASALASIDAPHDRTGTDLVVTDPGTEITIRVGVSPRDDQQPTPTPPYNAPGTAARPNVRAPGILRTTPVKPRRLGHVVVGSTDQERSNQIFQVGLGFKTSDSVPGLATFMRCSTDHHNVLVQQAPMAILHHTAWQVDDVDEVGRGATAMLEKDPGRHVWGLGRHHVGSNFFWYLKDPAGNFSEYYSDLDCVIDDALWEPGVWEGAHGIYNWGPPIPPSFLVPDDLAELMMGAHG